MRKFFLPVALLTIIFGTIYTVGQQIVRLGANEPQVQLAETVAGQLDNGASFGQVAGSHIDMANSLAPFVIIYDKSGKMLVGSGYLDGTVPTVPKGVLDNTSPSHDNRVTWEPKSGVRIASVTTESNDYFVLSGRNLRETEKLENHVLLLSFLGWGLAVVTTLAVYWLPSRSKKAKA